MLNWYCSRSMTYYLLMQRSNMENGGLIQYHVYVLDQTWQMNEIFLGELNHGLDEMH